MAAGMRALGLDIGEKRIGVAVSDPSGSIATPLKVLETSKVIGDARTLQRLAEDYDIELVVVGLPLSMDGTEGPQAMTVRRQAEQATRLLNVPIVYFDERLSSVQAKRAMTEAGVSDKAKRGSIDMVAASLFLQSYLDSHFPRSEGA